MSRLCIVTLQNISCEMPGWTNPKLESRLLGEISTTSDMQMTELLDEYESGQYEKVGLELNMQKTEIMASGPITSWQIDGEKVETVANFIFLGSKNHRGQ